MSCYVYEHRNQVYPFTPPCTGGIAFNNVQLPTGERVDLCGMHAEFVLDVRHTLALIETREKEVTT